jgi:hypothetical protein
VPFYFINLLPTSLLYISILLAWAHVSVMAHVAGHDLGGQEHSDNIGTVGRVGSVR